VTRLASDLVSPVDIYTPDQLEAHAARIAGTHRLSANPRRARLLLPRLDESAERLDEIYQFLSRAARVDPDTVGAEDWLRDNHHVVQDQVRDAITSSCPSLRMGPSAVTRESTCWRAS